MSLCLAGGARAQCLSWSTEFFHGPAGPVFALGSFDSGAGPELYVGGEFVEITDGTFAFCLTQWNGQSWRTLGSGVNATVWSMETLDLGAGPALYVGGEFSSAGGVQGTNHIAKWDGTSWSALGSGLDNDVYAMAVFDDGSGPALYAGGWFNGRIRKWDGTSWSLVGGGVGCCDVFALAVFDDGTGPALYVGGDFSTAGGVPANRIAKWDGVSWSPLGSGVGGFNVQGLLAFDDGNGPALYVGGNFTSAGGVPGMLGLAKWDGSSWSAVGNGWSDTAVDMVVLDDGGGPALFVTAENTVEKWDGTTWSHLGAGLGGPSVNTLTSFDDGSGGGPDLYAGGIFTEAGAIRSYTVAKWQGCATPLDTFCFGDGTVADCPCSNLASLGRGCRNSSGVGARLTTAGTPVPDTLVLSVEDERPSALTIFLQGDELIPATVPFGDGLRCLGGNLKRLYVKHASGGAVDAPQGGDPSITARSAALGDPISPGDTRYYQTYYRDPIPSFCTEARGGGTFNASNGVRVVW